MFLSGYIMDEFQSGASGIKTNHQIFLALFMNCLICTGRVVIHLYMYGIL